MWEGTFVFNAVIVINITDHMRAGIRPRGALGAVVSPESERWGSSGDVVFVPHRLPPDSGMVS